MRLIRLLQKLAFIAILAFASVGGAGLLQAQEVGPQSYVGRPNAPINDATSATSTINVPESGTISDVNVVVDIAHSHSGDLQITLTHGPTGRQTTLLQWLNGPGFAFGCGSDGIAAVFDDAASSPMDSYDCSSDFEAPVTGVWQPTGNLTTFNGINMAGSWTIEVNDTIATDNGTLNAWALIFNSDAPAIDPDGGAGGGDGGGGGGDPVADAMAIINGGLGSIPRCSTVSNETNGAMVATIPTNISFDVFCRVINQDSEYVRTAGEIGVDAVINMDVVQAVDVYSVDKSSTAQGTELCLRGAGGIIFLNAANSPRIPEWLPAQQQNGYTCASIPADGTAVLVSDGESPAMVEGQAPTVSTPASVALDNCQITTTYMVNIRDLPNLTTSEVIDMVPYDLTLQATERTSDWFRVIYLDFQGWINIDFLNPTGNCSM